MNNTPQPKAFFKGHRLPLIIATVLLAFFSLSSLMGYFSRETMKVNGTTFVAYKNEEHGFQFFYPEDWLIDEPSSANVAVFLATKSTKPIERGFFIVGIDKLKSPGESLASYTAETLQNLQEKIPDFTVLESRETVLGGQPTYEIIQTATVNGHSIKSRQIWYLKKGVAYNVSYSVSAYFYKRYEPAANKMFESFKIYS